MDIHPNKVGLNRSLQSKRTSYHAMNTYAAVARTNAITMRCSSGLKCGIQYTARMNAEKTRHFGFKYRGVPNRPPAITWCTE